MRLVSVDPGSRNTGFAFFDGDEIKLSGAVESSNENLNMLLYTIGNFGAEKLIIEKFTLFPSKAMQQSWDTLRVVEVIGILRFWAWQKRVPVILQQPSTKQGFPDERLRRDGDYVKNIHARDAIRHGRYYQRFGKEKENDV